MLASSWPMKAPKQTVPTASQPACGQSRSRAGRARSLPSAVHPVRPEVGDLGEPVIGVNQDAAPGPQQLIHPGLAQSGVWGRQADPGLTAAHRVANGHAGQQIPEVALDVRQLRHGGEDLPGSQDLRVSRAGPVHQQALRLHVEQHRGPNRVPFGVVRVEQARRRPSVHGGAELPPQVDRVLHAGVHALRPQRQVHVGGVAGQEHPPVPVLRGLPGGVGDAAGVHHFQQLHP